MGEIARRISSQEKGVPDLALPPGALGEIDLAYDYDATKDPSKIEPIEHRIRVDFAAAGCPSHDTLLEKYNRWNADPERDPHPWNGRQMPLALRYAEQTIKRTWKSEQRFFEHYDQDGLLNQAPEYLAYKLRQARSKSNPEEALEEEWEARQWWYKEAIPWYNLYQLLKQSTFGSLLPAKYGQKGYEAANTFVGVVVVDDRIGSESYAAQNGLSQQYVYQESEFVPDSDRSRSDTDAVFPSDYGFELPVPLLLGRFGSGSEYLFLPWSDGLICTCAYKHETSKKYTDPGKWRVACKHELMAAVILGNQDEGLLPVEGGFQVPSRARRLIAPEAYVKHEPSLPNEPI